MRRATGEPGTTFRPGGLICRCQRLGTAHDSPEGVQDPDVRVPVDDPRARDRGERSDGIDRSAVDAFEALAHASEERNLITRFRRDEVAEFPRAERSAPLGRLIAAPAKPRRLTRGRGDGQSTSLGRSIDATRSPCALPMYRRSPTRSATVV